MHRHEIRRTARGLATAIALIALGTPALHAQQGTAGVTAGLEEVIVTARKREETMQSVPLSVQAFSAEEMVQRGITVLSDVSLFTPGFSFDNYNGGLASPVIRGATQQNINALEQNVSTFFDGIYLPRGYIADLQLRDVERIEVIKGPQSARYGRNAFMGAINYVPVAPSDELRANASVSFGSDDYSDIAFGVGGPVVEGVLSLRGSYARTEFDGTVANTSPFANDVPMPGTEGNMGGYDREQYSAALRLTPTSWLDLEAAWYHFEYEDEATPTYSFGNTFGTSTIVNTNCGSQALGYRLYCGTLPAVDALFMDPRSYGRQMEADIYRAALDARFGEQFSASYVFGRVEADTVQVGFSDTGPTCPWLGPGCVFQNVPIGNLAYESHELRVRFEDSRFSATIGAYFSEGDDLNDFTFATSVPPLTAPATAPLDPHAPPFLFVSSTRTKTDDTSYFAELVVRLMDGRLRLGGEVRYGEEEKVQTNEFTGQAFQSKFDTTTPRFTADFDLTPSNLLYASAAEGSRSGGFNVAAGLAPEYRVYRPETNWTYEIGSKNRFMDDTLQVNAALFYVDAKDTQISSTPPNSPPGTAAILLNLGSYTSKGIELNAQARIASHLSLNAGIAYTDATYDQAFDVRYVVPCTPPVGQAPVCPVDGNLAGKELPRQSPWSGTVGVQYDSALPFGEDWSWSARADLAYQSSQYVDQMNLADVDARTLVNATLGLDYRRFSGSLWARNLFDENYVSQAFFTPGANSLYSPIIGQERLYGVTLAFRY